MSIPVQDQNSDIKPIGLRSESEIGMQSNFSDRKDFMRQWFDVRVENVVS